MLTMERRIYLVAVVVVAIGLSGCTALLTEDGTVNKVEDPEPEAGITFNTGSGLSYTNVTVESQVDPSSVNIEGKTYLRIVNQRATNISIRTEVIDREIPIRASTRYAYRPGPNVSVVTIIDHNGKRIGVLNITHMEE